MVSVLRRERTAWIGKPVFPEPPKVAFRVGRLSLLLHENFTGVMLFKAGKAGAVITCSRSGVFWMI